MGGIDTPIYGNYSWTRVNREEILNFMRLAYFTLYTNYNII